MCAKDKNKRIIPKDTSEASRDPHCPAQEEGVSDEEKEYYSLGGDNDLRELENYGYN